MNNKKRIWNFYEIQVENKRCNFHQKLKKHFTRNKTFDAFM